jgi:membrane-bound serine protease (ClpP class)
MGWLGSLSFIDSTGVIIFIVWKLNVQIPFWVYILAGVVCAVVYWLLYCILLDQRKKSPVGSDSMIELRYKTITPLNPEGLVRVQGEIWKAASKSGVIAEG